MADSGHDEMVRARGTVVQLVFGHMAAQTLAAAVRLGLADRIGDGERTAADLAAEVPAHPQSMHRLLRALAGLGLLSEHEPGSFGLSSTGALLRTDRPDSLSALVRMFTDPAMIASWQRLDGSVRSGRTAFDDVFGTDFFTHLERNPELSALFNASMSQGTLGTAAVLPGVYDFARFGTVADIGGGDGTLLAAVLNRHPGLRGILFDSAAGLAEAPDILARAGVADRCDLVSGDFFAAVPGADLYLMKSIVHDWDDDRVVTILGHCRRALPAHGRVLIVEPVLPEVVDPAGPGLTYLSDLNMLVNVGGRERTRADFEEVCRRAGLAVTEVTPLPAPATFSLIEAVPA